MPRTSDVVGYDVGPFFNVVYSTMVLLQASHSLKMAASKPTSTTLRIHKINPRPIDALFPQVFTWFRCPLVCHNQVATIYWITPGSVARKKVLKLLHCLHLKFLFLPQGTSIHTDRNVQQLPSTS